MPAEGIHLTALGEAAVRDGLSTAARRAIARYRDASRLGAIALDLPYFDRYREEVVRYAAGLSPRESSLGADVHGGGAIDIVLSVVELARERRSDDLAALALGLASHVAIDRQLHPLVNALARAHAGGRSHDAAHREVEKLQSICFHETYLGSDRMGTAGITRLVEVPVRELLANASISGVLEAAYAKASKSPPSVKDLKRMGQGYEEHAALIGSPLGRLLASTEEKDRARPKFLQAAWGSFEAILELAIAASVEVLDVAYRACVASPDDIDASMAELRRFLTPGTIDGMGEKVDLGVPFVPERLWHG